MGKVGPSSPYVTMLEAIVGKLWLSGNGVMNIREKTPLSKQNKPFFGWGRFSCCIPVVPKVI